MAFWRDMTPKERSAFWACFGGWALDAMDVQLYSFVMPSLIVAWSMSKAEAGTLATSALLFSAAGGWIAGLLADRIGRVRTLQITIVWFAVFTCLSGFAHGYWGLFWARAMLGLGFGGEWAAGAVLMGEVIRAEYRGRAVGTVQAGWALGWGVSALLYTVIFQVLPEAYAWRVLFFCGIAPALLVLFIRKNVSEPDVWKAAPERGRFLDIFGPDTVRTTFFASLLATGAQGGYYAITAWLPTYLKTVRGLSVQGTGGSLAVVIVGSFCGYIISAHLADAIGRKRNFYLFSLGSMATVLLYTHVEFGRGALALLGFPLGFFASGIFSGMGAFFTELFPTRVRASGQGFSYNFGRGIGALFPSVIGVLAATLGLGKAIGLFAAAAYLVLFAAALALPETAGKELAPA
ncbi:MAG TPA: MFS transporter [Myxococcales bacterium]|jgi:MFS family permease